LKVKTFLPLALGFYVIRTWDVVYEKARIDVCDMTYEWWEWHRNDRRSYV